MRRPHDAEACVYCSGYGWVTHDWAAGHTFVFSKRQENVAVTERDLLKYAPVYGSRYTRSTRRGNSWQSIIIGPDTVAAYEAHGSKPIAHSNGR